MAINSRVMLTILPHDRRKIFLFLIVGFYFSHYSDAYSLNSKYCITLILIHTFYYILIFEIWMRSYYPWHLIITVDQVAHITQWHHLHIDRPLKYQHENSEVTETWRRTTESIDQSFEECSIASDLRGIETTIAWGKYKHQQLQLK